MSKKNKEILEATEEIVEAVEKEQATEVAESTELAVEVVENKEPVIYLGPTLYGVATKGTIYNNGLPEELTNAIKENPIIGSLIVKISEANYVRAELKRNGSAYSIFYDRIKK